MRRPTIIVVSLLLATLFFVFFVSAPSKHNQYSVDDIRTDPSSKPASGTPDHVDKEEVSRNSGGHIAQDVISGTPIMAKMTNETLKAELGRSAWKVFHTILAQYPEKPSQDDRDTLSSYIHLFSRVYPCRQCAEHFQILLKEFPPQVSSRERASQWGCHVHNLVNRRLGKPQFDCNEISDKYACGCGEDEEDGKENKIVLDEKETKPTRGG